MKKATREYSHRPGRGLSSIALASNQINDRTLQELAALGVVFPQEFTNAMAGFHVAMDGNDVGILPASPNTLTTPSIVTPLQFLQAWLPGFVHTVTAARKIDELIGISTIGKWEDEEVVQGMLEPIGGAKPYTDHGNIPLSSYNVAWERRSIARFELGMEVGLLEEARAGRVNISSSAEKRGACAVQLDIVRNRVGFYGFNNGANRLYGFLNDPSAPAYVNVPAGAGGGTSWAGKTFQEITLDWRTAFASLRTASKGVIDPKKTPITAVVPTSRIDYLTTTTDFGLSVLDWLRTNYPNVRIEDAPEMDDANGGATAWYLYADSIEDGSTDDKRTWIQIVPVKFMTIGVDKGVKTYVEDYGNAVGGVMLKRPYALRRYSGV